MTVRAGILLLHVDVFNLCDFSVEFLFYLCFLLLIAMMMAELNEAETPTNGATTTEDKSKATGAGAAPTDVSGYISTHNQHTSFINYTHQ